MIQYAVCEIAGRQYKVEPGKTVDVNYLGDTETIECDKVLLIVEEGKLQLGQPYLKEKLVFDVVEKLQKEKIRVATYHAKANTRRVVGGKKLSTKIKLHI